MTKAETMAIPFSDPVLTGKELEYIGEVFHRGRFAGDGRFSRLCAGKLEELTGCRKAFPVSSGTSALEMMMMLAGIGAGDEVIMPSFTFSSTANAVVLRGGIPVFIDIREDTLNMDEEKIEAAVTPRTKAVVPVHYGGVACAMDRISSIAARHGLLVLEDAAHGIFARYRGKHLGTLGHMGILSFHETKNVHCGEGGALLVNDPGLLDRAEIVEENGTDRRRFLQGEISEYSWVDEGSSYLMNEVTAAFLLAQLEGGEAITAARRALWTEYHESLESLEKAGCIRRPVVPRDCLHNGHIYALLLRSSAERKDALEFLKERGVGGAFHFIPLGTSKAGRCFCRSVPEFLPVTAGASERILRLPLHSGLRDLQVVVSLLRKFFIEREGVFS